jgi:CHAD domain-containing protein
MAKADEIVGLNCAADASLWAAEVLRVRFGEVARLRQEALESVDVEAVHSMRVATRRLRSALRDFALFLKRRPVKKAIKDLKRIADALGSARDEDVAIARLEKLLAKAETEEIKRGIENLIGVRRVFREKAQIELKEVLSAETFDDVQKRFIESIEKAIKPQKSRRAVSFSRAGSEAVAARSKEFLDLSDALYFPADNKALHELRISAKRLRYSIEIFESCLGEKASDFAEQIAEMQTFLGEVHDADVWIEDLSERFAKNFENELQTNLWLLSEFVKRRAKNYRRALSLWGVWRENNFLEKLNAAISQAS